MKRFIFALLLVGCPGPGSNPDPVDAGVPDSGEPLVREFSITLYSDDPDKMPPGAAEDLLSAADRWAQVIVDDIPDVVIPVGDQADCELSGEVDDVAIIANFIPIDGPGNVLGRAGPLCLRESLLPISGIMEFDIDDYDPVFFSQTALHEMGHVLGIGTLWSESDFDLLQDPSCNFFGCIPRNTRYTGENANREWRALVNTEELVPVENQMGPGSSDAHWRESGLSAPLRNELMSPALSAVFEPLSTITVGALGDLGYGVDYGAADSFEPAFRVDDAEMEPILYGDERTHRSIFVLYNDGTKRLLRKE